MVSQLPRWPKRAAALPDGCHTLEAENLEGTHSLTRCLIAQSSGCPKQSEQLLCFIYGDLIQVQQLILWILPMEQLCVLVICGCWWYPDCRLQALCKEFQVYSLLFSQCFYLLYYKFYYYRFYYYYVCVFVCVNMCTCYSVLVEVRGHI